MKLRVCYVLSALAVCLALYFPVAEAHTLGAQGAGLAEGLSHPFAGWDHLLAMLAVGWWAALLGGRAVWWVPSAFVGVMAVAAGFGFSGMELPLLESGIAASLVVLGLLVTLAVRLSAWVCVGVVGLMAVFHGFAHGLELPQAANPGWYALGFVLSTLMLLGIGLTLGLTTRRLVWLRLGGSLIALSGLYLLAAV
jgi:urease accessory protein